MSSHLAPRGVRPWWRDAVTYQIYIRSFADSNGDGIGDVEGIRSKLPYLKKLGVDAIWITPWYPSPQNDHGYDVSDYMNIEPDYGSLKDAEKLIKDAHDHGITRDYIRTLPGWPDRIARDNSRHFFMLAPKRGTHVSRHTTGSLATFQVADKFFFNNVFWNKGVLNGNHISCFVK